MFVWPFLGFIIYDIESWNLWNLYTNSYFIWQVTTQKLIHGRNTWSMVYNSECSHALSFHTAPCTSSSHSNISYTFVEEFCQSWIAWIGVIKSLITEWFQVLASVSFIRPRIGGKIFSIIVIWFVCLATNSNSEGTWAVRRINVIAEVQV